MTNQTLPQRYMIYGATSMPVYSSEITGFDRRYAEAIIPITEEEYQKAIRKNQSCIENKIKDTNKN